MEFRPCWPAFFLVLISVTICACSGRPADASHQVGASPELKPATVYIADEQYIYTPSPRYRPRSVVLAGDGSYELTNMTWSTWSATTARGTGTALIDDCKPSCASGRFYHVPVVGTFTRPVKACKAVVGATTATIRYFWSRANLTYPSGLPAPVRTAYGLWVFSGLIDMAHQTCS